MGTAESRTKNSIMNISSSVAYQILNLLLSFISRTVFIRILGIEYLGISGLFGDILTMLTLADLGFGTAMTYSMYKPLAEHDYETLAGLTCLYKKIYRVIALTITMVGLALIPVLPCLVKLDKPMPHLTLYYVLFLANTVASYLVIYKTNILSADQKSYVLTKYTAIFNVLQTVVLMVTLLITRSYIVYLVMQVAFIYISNFYKSHVAQKMYPFINQHIELPKEQTKGLFKNISSVFLYKISSVLINATDNTLISTLIGTIWVGYYSNYSIVITKLTGIVNTFFYSLTASLGNLIVKEDANRRFEVFQIMQSISCILAMFCVPCILILEEDFVRVWLGEDFLLGGLVLIAIALNFYFSIVLLPIWVFREAAGLYRKTKYVMLTTAGINIITSIIFGKLIGLAGILFATSFSRLVTYFWYEPKILFEEYFEKKCFTYFFEIVKNFGYTLITVFVVGIASKWIVPSSWASFLLKSCFVGMSSLTMALIFYHKSSGFTLLLNRLKEVWEAAKIEIRRN